MEFDTESRKASTVVFLGYLLIEENGLGRKRVGGDV